MIGVNDVLTFMPFKGEGNVANVRKISDICNSGSSLF
jgi:hypothetical protein